MDGVPLAAMLVSGRWCVVVMKRGDATLGHFGEQSCDVEGLKTGPQRAVGTVLDGHGHTATFGAACEIRFACSGA